MTTISQALNNLQFDTLPLKGSLVFYRTKALQLELFLQDIKDGKTASPIILLVSACEFMTLGVPSLHNWCVQNLESLNRSTPFNYKNIPTSVIEDLSTQVRQVVQDNTKLIHRPILEKIIALLEPIHHQTISVAEFDAIMVALDKLNLTVARHPKNRHIDPNMIAVTESDAIWLNLDRSNKTVSQQTKYYDIDTVVISYDGLEKHSRFSPIAVYLGHFNGNIKLDNPQDCKDFLIMLQSVLKHSLNS